MWSCWVRGEDPETGENFEEQCWNCNWFGGFRQVCFIMIVGKLMPAFSLWVEE